MDTFNKMKHMNIIFNLIVNINGSTNSYNC